MFTNTYTLLDPIPTSQCASMIQSWAQTHNDMKTPILCDVDMDGDNKGDVTMQYWSTSCGGTPQNIYVSQGHIIYKRVCGAETAASTIINNISPEVNGMTCE